MARKPSPFQLRCQQLLPQLISYFTALYPQGDASQLEQLLQHAWKRRSPALKKWDSRPLTHKLTGLSISLDQEGTTLAQLRNRLADTAALGIDYLYLPWVLSCPEAEADDGTAVSDYRRVQPSFGTMADLERLTAHCHSLGISVGTQLVMSHTSDQHPWALAAKEGDAQAQACYHIFDSMEIPTWYNTMLPDALPLSQPGSFSPLPQTGQIVMTTFHSYQWDLNYRNPQVLLEMASVLLNLANKGVDVIRLSGLSCIWKEPGTNCRCLPQSGLIVQMLHLMTQIICPGMVLVSDEMPCAGTQRMTWKQLPCTLLHTAAAKDVGLLCHQLTQSPPAPLELQLIRPEGSHWELDFGYLAARGSSWAGHVGFLNDYYTGKFPGSTGKGALDREMRLTGTVAQLCGGDTQLELLLWAALLTMGADTLLAPSEPVLHSPQFAQLIAAAKRLPARKGFLPLFAGPQSVAAIQLAESDPTHILVFNFSPDPQPGWLEAVGSYRDLISGQVMQGDSPLPLAPWQYCFLVQEPPVAKEE